MTSPYPLRVLIIADDILVRAGLVALLQPYSTLDIIGQIDRRESLSDDIEQYMPEALLYDAGWSYDEANDTLEELRQNQIPLLILSESDQVSHLHNNLLSDDIPLTHFGMIPRQSDGTLIEMTLQAIAQGLIVIAPEFAETFFTQQSHQESQLLDTLTPRENEVLQLLAQGMTNKAIALALGITDHTVKYHVNAIMGKLNAQSRTDAVIRATRAGLILL